MLAPFTSELDRIAPSFQINGSQIRVLRTPSDFYDTLKVCRRGHLLSSPEADLMLAKNPAS